MSAANWGGAVQVGDWVVHPALDTISRGDETHKLEPRTMRLLLCLVEAAGGVVSVDRLLSEVWTGVVVGPASVYQAISQLRKLLHDVDPEPTYIATVPRKGYRLIAAARPIDHLDVRDAGTWVDAGIVPGRVAGDPAAGDHALSYRIVSDHTVGGTVISRAKIPVPTLVPPTSTAPPRRWAAVTIVAVGLIAAALLLWPSLQKYRFADAPGASIVVLPFVDLTVEKTGQPFCDGLAEELSNWLSQIPTLRVVARTSAFAFRGSSEDVRKIGKDLNTDHVLEGSMRRSGDHMRVTVQLIDARNGYHLWSAEYDRPMADMITIQDDISRSVAQNLQIRLTRDTAQRFAARRSENSQAYQTYLQARYYEQQRKRDSNNRAIELYRRVLSADPKFALAYVGLSYSLLNQQWLDERAVGEVAAEVEPLIATAISLDEQLSDAYTVRAELRSDQNRIKEAQDDLRLALSLNPNDSRAFEIAGRLWLLDGQPRDAASSFKHAIALDPLDFRLHTQLCTAFEDMARYADAQLECQRAHELQPDNAAAVDGLAKLALSRGAIADALRWNAESLKYTPDEFDYYWTRAELYWTLGLLERARETLKQGRASTKDHETADAVLGHLAYLEGGAEKLRSYLKEVPLDASRHSVVLLETAHLRLLLAEPSTAQDLIKRALEAADYRPDMTDTPWLARFGESCQLKLATAELELGDRSSALPRLAALVGMLDRMIGAGVERAPVYELRAEAEAMRGHADAAMQDLTKAATLGWRRVRWAQHEPYFASLQSRQDFQQLMNRVGQSNDQLLEQLKLNDAPEI